jgi:hypothetical protein
VGPTGADGPKGDKGLGFNPDLPKIIDIAWDHNKEVKWETFRDRLLYLNDPAEWLQKLKNNPSLPPPFLTVYFNREMTGITRQTFRVSLEFPQMSQSIFSGIYNFPKVDLYGYILPLGRTLQTPHTLESSPFPVAFIPAKEFFNIVMNLTAWDAQSLQPPLDLPTVNVLLKGDFIYGPGLGPSKPYNEQAVLDADNIGGQVGLNRLRGGPITGSKNPSGDMVQGGDFESWFFLSKPVQAGQPPNKSAVSNSIPDLMAGASGPAIDVNRASPEELLNARGISDSTARRIIGEREKQPFRDLEDFKSRIKPQASNWNLMRDDITVEPAEE